MVDPEPRNPPKPIPYRPGIFLRLSNYLKLLYRLLVDRRVSFMLKLIPLGAVLYAFSPLDWILPVVDDLVIAWLAVYLFVELSPPEIVDEHRKAIESVLAGQCRDTTEERQIDPQDIIDGEFHEKQGPSGGRI
jgi:uncharacterized membrane protein YkvA (DUF1232 family)